jgi:hypothetical protein
MGNEACPAFLFITLSMLSIYFVSLIYSSVSFILAVSCWYQDMSNNSLKTTWGQKKSDFTMQTQVAWPVFRFVSNFKPPAKVVWNVAWNIWFHVLFGCSDWRKKIWLESDIQKIWFESLQTASVNRAGTYCILTWHLPGPYNYAIGNRVYFQNTIYTNFSHLCFFIRNNCLWVHSCVYKILLFSDFFIHRC